MILLKKLKGHMRCLLLIRLLSLKDFIIQKKHMIQFFLMIIHLINSLIMSTSQIPMKNLSELPRQTFHIHHSSIKKQLRNIFGDLSLSTSSNKFNSFQESNMQLKMNQQKNYHMKLSTKIVHRSKLGRHS